MEAHHYFPMSALCLCLLWICADSACCHSLHELICASILLCLEDTVFLISSVPSGFCSCFAFSSLSPERRDLIETYHVVVSMYRKKFLWWWLSESLIYGYSRMLVWIILLLHPFSRIIFAFLLSLLLASWPPWQCWTWILAHGVSLKYNQMVISYYFPQWLCHYCTSITKN